MFEARATTGTRAGAHFSISNSAETPDRGWHDPGNEKILEGACERLEPYLQSQMVGQEMAIRQFSDAVCDHLNQAHPQKPLVVSAHGSPGVGKSFMHKLAARALYNRQPHLDLDCPGMDCPSLKVASSSLLASCRLQEIVRTNLHLCLPGIQL